MPKAMCIIGSIVALLLVLLFGLDVFIGIPFKTHSTLMDVIMIIAGVVMVYLSWATLREQS